MNSALLDADRRVLRGSDSNSLLRMYDAVNGIFARSPSQQERARADRAIQRIVKELQRRNVPFVTSPT